MTNQQRITALNSDPRVVAMIEDATGYLLHLAPGWLHDGQPVIFHRKMRVLHGTLLPQARPDPRRPPDLRGWRCEATVPGLNNGWTFHPGFVIDTYPGGIMIKVAYRQAGIQPVWHSIKQPKVRAFAPPDAPHQTTDALLDLFTAG
jgi:hypothetical protein